MADRIKWSLIGIPDHQGVMNVGGRLGAALGPRHLFRALKKMTGATPLWSELSSEKMVEGLGSDIEENLLRAATVVSQHQPRGGVSCVVGGGHDHGYSQLLGIQKFFQAEDPSVTIGCINIDAHLDVRPPIPQASSGSPFRLAIERSVILPKNLIEFGIQTHCNSLDLQRYVQTKQIETIWFEDLKAGRYSATDVFARSLEKLTAQVDQVVVSLDLDSAAECYAPGVSAPQSEGFTSSELISLMKVAGENPKVVSLGVFELNPLHDIDERTARLGAKCIHRFVESVLKR